MEVEQATSARIGNDSMSSETRRAPVGVPSIAWKVAAVAWAGVIFSMSTGSFGPGFTLPLLTGALSLVHLTVSPPSFEILHLCVRKAAHLTEYAILAALLAKSSEEPPFPWRERRLLACFLIVAAYALTDEFHQSFAPGRTASLKDCGFDSIGGAVGILLYYFNHLRLRAASSPVTCNL